jgi:MFS family permease
VDDHREHPRLLPGRPDQAAPILGAVNVIATYFAFRWIDKVGRRPLALWGHAGMAVFMLVAAAGVGFLTGVPKTVLVMVGFSVFITSFAIGVGGTGWLIQGEVFPHSRTRPGGRNAFSPGILNDARTVRRCCRSGCAPYMGAGAAGGLAVGLRAAGEVVVAGRAGLPTVLRWRRAWA